MFEKIIGNEYNKKVLSRIENPSHAYIFTGKQGVGKKMFANELAYKWSCTAENKPCGVCKSCIQFNGGNSPDFQIITPTENSLKIDQIREVIKKLNEKPISSEKKIYIIDDADKMTMAAQNALLKVLEEPPKYIIIILIGSNENLFINTIKSRCIKINFEPINKVELLTYIKQNVENHSENNIELYDGSIGKIHELNGKELQYKEVVKLLVNLSSKNKLEFIKQIPSLLTKEDAKNMLQFLNNILLKKIREEEKYINIIQIIDNTILKIDGNQSFEMIIDEMIFEICDLY